MVKKSICIFFIGLLMCSLFITPASAYKPSTFTVSAEGCVLASLDNGAIIYQKNSEEKLYPASLTKVMTAVVVLDNCEDLESTMITVKESALLSLQGTDSSVFNLVEGEQLRAIDLLNILLIASANDAANALAEYIGGGSVSEFVKMMNQKATDLGMSGTHFVNAHGLHDDNHYTTPMDMLRLMQYACEKEVFNEIIGRTRYNVPATNKSKGRLAVTTVFMKDPNSVMPSTYYRYTTGGKTGYTDEAGRCLVSTAKKNGASYVCVLMKCPVKDEAGNKVRKEFAETKQLFEWVFNDFEYRQIYDTKTPVGECPVTLSQESDYVTLVLGREVNAVIPKGTDNSTIKIEIDLYSDSVEAPVTQGQELGMATVKYAGEIIDSVPVTAMVDVKRSTLLAFVKGITDFFTSSLAVGILIIIILIILMFIFYCMWINRGRKTKHRKRVRTR